jgi:type II secretory pathway component PulF
MQTASLHDFEALNAQLAALVGAGIPLDVGLSQREIPAVKELERINAIVTRRVARGESLTEALDGDEQDVPAAYRSMVQYGLHTGNLSGALDGSNRVAESIEDSRFTFEAALLYPLIVCGLAYLGLIGFSVYLAPILEDMYVSLNLPTGSGVRALLFLRETLRYWVAIPPVALLAIIGWWLRSKSRRASKGIASHRLLRWLPGMSQGLFHARCSRFAASLAALLENQTPLPEALLIAGDASSDTDLTLGARSLAAAEQKNQPPSDDSSIAKRFPPFLRWAIWHSDATTGRVRALEIAARMYRDASERRAERLRTLAPMAAIVLIGGTVTLLYGLTLFVPVVELLKSLASSNPR